MNYYLILLRQEIHKLRMSLGYSVTVMADKIGVSKRAFQAYEGGRACPTKKHFLKLLEAANIATDSEDGKYLTELHWFAVKKANVRRAISKRKNKNG